MPLLRRVVIVLFVLVAAVLLLGGLATIGSQTGAGATLLFLAILTSGLAWWMRHDWRRHRSGLTVVVRADRLELTRDGRPPDVVVKPDVGLIVLHFIHYPGTIGQGVLDFQIFRPDQSLLGPWETGWDGAGPIQSIRAFRRYGYPWILHDPGALVWNDKFHSKSAPSWANQVLGA
jgi:hypothetical protein